MKPRIKLAWDMDDGPDPFKGPEQEDIYGLRKLE
jgi:hypothetical protein